MLRKSLLVCTLALLAAPLFARANLSIQGARVIYDQARSEVDVHVRQVGKTPGVIQMWLDEGDDTANAEALNPAFTLAPSIAWLVPGARQIVRIVRSRDDLPDDRESLLWLNFLETPQAASGEALPGVRTRLKFFYRPSGLPVPPETAHQALRFALEPGMADGTLHLRVMNPTPYHITFRELIVQEAVESGAVLAAFGTDAPGERMVAPMGELVLHLTCAPGHVMPATTGLAVVFSIINDDGGASAGQSVLQPALQAAMLTP